MDAFKKSSTVFLLALSLAACGGGGGDTATGGGQAQDTMPYRIASCAIDAAWEVLYGNSQIDGLAGRVTAGDGRSLAGVGIYAYFTWHPSGPSGGEAMTVQSDNTFSAGPSQIHTHGNTSVTAVFQFDDQATYGTDQCTATVPVKEHPGIVVGPDDVIDLGPPD
jgi:hypothetical protein